MMLLQYLMLHNTKINFITIINIGHFTYDMGDGQIQKTKVDILAICAILLVLILLFSVSYSIFLFIRRNIDKKTLQQGYKLIISE